MARKEKKVAYVVKIGRKPGIYQTWSECEKQTRGFSGAAHRGYFTQEAAETAWNEFLAEKRAELALKSTLQDQSVGQAISTLEIPDSEGEGEDEAEEENPRSVPDAVVSCN